MNEIKEILAAVGFFSLVALSLFVIGIAAKSILPL